MTDLGRRCAIGAIALAVVTAAMWSQGRADPMTAPDGASLFHVKGCAACHAGPGSEPPIDGFPRLTDVAAWAGVRRPGLSAEDYLHESILAPDAFVAPGNIAAVGPTPGMPRLQVDAAEAEALVGYLLGG